MVSSHARKKNMLQCVSHLTKLSRIMQNQNTDNLSGVALFVQLAQAGSFVAAARQAGISPSAVSKSLARLEQRLGARLFQLSTRQLSLTAEGKLFLARSETILAEMQAAQEELAGQRAPRGRLRLGLPELGGLFLPALAAFSRQHPAIALELDFSDALADVVGEGLDAVIRIGAPRDSRLAARKLGQFRSCLVASPAYLARHGTPLSCNNMLACTTASATAARSNSGSCARTMERRRRSCPCPWCATTSKHACTSPGKVWASPGCPTFRCTTPSLTAAWSKC